MQHNRIPKRHREEGREHNRVNHAVQGQPLIVVNPENVCRADNPRARQHLVQPQQHAQNEQKKRDDELAQQNEPYRASDAGGVPTAILGTAHSNAPQVIPCNLHGLPPYSTIT